MTTHQPEPSDVSQPFEIELIDSRGYAGKRQVRFKLQDGKPVKLGDGSFGVVYEGVGDGDEPAAIKLLYDNASIDPRALSELSEDELTGISTIVADHIDCLKDKRADFLRLVLDNRDKPDRLPLALVQWLGQPGEGIDAQSGLSVVETILQRLREGACSTAVERFDRESRISMYLRRADNGRSTATLSGTVVVWGGTKRFRSSEPYVNQLRAYFAEQKIAVSDFALVMDRFDGSLKDLLEKRLSKAEAEQRASGYSLLRGLSLDDRIGEALLFLYPITVGLERLHNAKSPENQPFFHLDMKPGNVFVREDERSEELQAALGDLGYLPPIAFGDSAKALTDDTLTLAKRTELAPGTPHYRSPEQKDYMDVAYSAVTHEGAGPDAKVVLIVNDTKFKNNLIEPEDFVIVSKDKSRTPYNIVKIDPVPNTEHDLRIELDADATRLVPEERTQVEFHKRQAYRTDLFGVGAIAFDIITGGESPERFYESIRKFEGRAVTDIVDKYKRLKVGLAEGDDPDLQQIFRPFRGGDDADSLYADEQVVELILKCLLYKSDGTFYAPYAHPDRKTERGKAVTELKKAIRELRDKPQYLRSASQSVLIHGSASRATPLRLRRFDDEIDILQGLKTWPTSAKPAAQEATVADDPLLREANRLMLGALYFVQLTTLVRDYTPTAEDSSTRAFLYEMIPEYISIEQDNDNVHLKLEDFTFKDYDAYLKDLRQNRLGRMVRAAFNPFVPNWIASMRREIRLFPAQDEAPSADTLIAQYRMTDASPYDLPVSVGDWVATQQQQQQRLWRIEAVTGDTLRLKPHVDPDASRETVSGDKPKPQAGPDATHEPLPAIVDAFFYAQLDPFKYYLDMLGLYLQHLIFAYSPFTTVTRDKLDPADILSSLGFATDVVLPMPTKPSAQAEVKTAPIDESSKNKRKWFSFGNGNPEAAAAQPEAMVDATELQYLYDGFAHLLLELSVHESEDSFYHKKLKLDADDVSGDKGEHSKEILNKVSDRARKRYEDVLEFFGRKGMTQPPQRPKPLRQLDPEAREIMQAATAQRFGIADCIRRAGLVEQS